MDLSLFQFDYDLTFAVFFLNADKTVYGRFSSRSDRKDATKEITLKFRSAGGRRTCTKVIQPTRLLWPASNRSPRFKAPDDYPSCSAVQATLDYEGKVVQSCMHCHQVREAERVFFRADRKAIPDEVLYPWPMPDVIGLALDPKEKAKVREVARGSAAARAGFKAGDEIVSLDGQPLLSIADVQWVLHLAPQPARLKAEVLRGNNKRALTLNLSKDWRRQSDISWRVTTWDLRRMATGGLVLREATAEERRQANLPDSALALRVEHVGEYGDHAAAKRAGFKKDDLVVSVDDQAGRLTESELLGYLLQNKMPGARVPVAVLRAGERVNLELPMQ